MEKAWKQADVAAFLQVSEDSIPRMMTSQGLPKPVALIGGGKGERVMKRWLPEEVQEWFRSQKRAA